ncbi:MAG: bifunctional 5,10-methylenetetrahydrofolate dehydrogenase/5,10-methenyltetrahydrofolate cyclohydrolase [Candidatus Nomurabacteria bacterium]|nr:MAG: bifunctional 5,10-methylenetetrahydrofolate dehydrogenase/5,10-methenyltetrahydrofolate cyclohydrolase [Candidatus Nomurabacteria bacterium]
MARSLNGRELAEYVQERQARQVRALRQAHNIFPKLAIAQTIDDPVIDSYVRLKQNYGTEILIDVEVYKVDQSQLAGVIDRLNNDPSVHGIIIQLPLADPSATQEAVDSIVPEKDVDGLGSNATLDPATPTAITWLLAGYNVDLANKKIAIVGNGRLVGKPLNKMWQTSGYDVTVFDENSENMNEQLPEFDVIVTATGVPGLIKSGVIKHGAVVVDAGTASEHGKIVGDVAADVRERDDVSITPIKGGVGPLTVTALFDNVIRAAQATEDS